MAHPHPTPTANTPATQGAEAPELENPIGDVNEDRRAFLINTTVALGVAGAACVALPFIKTLAPNRAVQATATADFDLTTISPGTLSTQLWQGKPVFILHRTPAQIVKAQAQDATSTMDPEADALRVQKPEWLVVLGICSHLGCVPMQGGESEGWRCPCHGSQFDLSGRVTQGPAGKNLEVPKYRFLDDNTIRIG